MTIIARISVVRTHKISIDARILFLSLNWRYENKKLAIRFNAKGNAIKYEISWLHDNKNTFQNEIAIMTYKTVRTGQKIRPGGDRDGFFIWPYRLRLSVLGFVFCII